MLVPGILTGASRDRLQRLRKELETRVQQRTKSVRVMLDISGQAVFTFDPGFKVLPDYSSVCRDFFGMEIGGLDVRQLLFDSESQREDFTQGMNLLFSHRAQPDVVFDLLEEEMVIQEKLSRVVYRFIEPDRVLVGLTDISESKELNIQLQKEERNKEMIFTAVSHQSYFRDLLRDAEDIFFQLDSIIATESQDPPRIRTLQNSLHTFRGNLSFFHFDNTHQLVDELETYIGDMLSLEEPVEFHGSGLALKRVYFQELRNIVNTLGEDWLQGVDSVQVPRRQFQQLINYIREYYPSDSRLLSSLQTFYKVPMKTLFSQYPHMSRDISSKLGKRIEPLEIHGGDFMVLPDTYRDFSSSCIHLIRNMIDHGIESVLEREELGKSPEGRIELKISRQNSSIILQFSDDGRGIEYAKVAKKAHNRGLISSGETPNKSELIKVLFRSGFSTSSNTMDVSGKGVGLAAVKQEVKKLNGNIKVKSQQNKGTTFTIELPIKDGTI